MSEMQTPTSGVTFRSLLAGALIAFCISVGAPYGNMVLRGSPAISTAGDLFFIFIFHSYSARLAPSPGFPTAEPAVV